jgi:F420-non-reducing hydrogenase small subunit
MSKTKPKIAIYWCASCGGCEETVVDLAEDILGVVEALDIVLWPVAMDFKYSDVHAIPDGALLATLLNGAIRSSEQEEMARLLRRKSQYLIAYGSCAVTGGIPGLANQFSKEQMLKYVYEETPTMVNKAKTRPQLKFTEAGREVHLPELWNVVRSLDQVVDVDYYVPGCPPTPNLTKEAVGALLSGKLPPKGSVLAPDQALCGECARRDSKPTDVAFVEFKRPHEKLLDPNLCFLAQGVVCMGPATRCGCGSQCVEGNMPCTGCFGPTSRVHDQGAKILSSLSANVVAKDEAGIRTALAGIPDPVGTFYRYGLAKSLLRRRVDLAMTDGNGNGNGKH